MSLTLQSTINTIPGVNVNNALLLGYLFEPFPVSVFEDTDQTFDLDIVEQSQVLADYGAFDVFSSTTPVVIDLALIIRQLYNHNVFRYGTIDDLVANPGIFIDFAPNFNFEGSSNFTLRVDFLIGSRPFRDILPLSGTTPLTTREIQGLDISDRWVDYPILTSSIITSGGRRTGQVTVSRSTTGCETMDGGMLIWKSRLSGWNQWAFPLIERTPAVKLENDFEVGLFNFDRTLTNQNPFVELDYASATFDESIRLRSLNLTQQEVLAVSDILQSPVVYWLSEPFGRLEAVRARPNLPINNLQGGNDFEVNISLISNGDFKVR